MAQFVLDDPNWGLALVLAFLLLAILGAVAAMALRKPVFFRMSLRNAFRRRSQTLVVILGLMVGTAILSASLVASDSMEYLIVEDVYTGQYLVDEWVSTDSMGTFNMSVFDVIATDGGVMAVTDGLSPIILIGGTSINNLADGQTETGVNLQGIDFTRDRALGAFVSTDGSDVDGADLGPLDAIVPDSLARSARIDIGDAIMVFYMPPLQANATSGGGSGGSNGSAEIHFVTLTVRGIVKTTGKTAHNGGRTVYVTLEAAQAIVGAPGAINAIKVSNVGGVVDGAKRSDDAVAALETALDDAAPMAGLTGEQFSVNPAKQKGVEAAKDEAEGMGLLLLLASSFTVIAGTLLIVNIFTMLAEERKKELGISRAIGMRRSSLVRTFTFEGVVYSLIAATIGTLVGLAIGWALMNAFLGAIDDSVGTIPFYYKDSSVLIAFCVGSMITIATVAYSSWKVSKLNIVRSIRSMEEPRVRKGGMKHVYQGGALLGLGLVLSFLGFGPADSVVLMAVGPCLAIMGLCMVAKRWVSPELANSLMGLGVLGYSAWGLFNLEADDTEGMMATVMVGILLVGGTVLTIVSNSRAIVRGVGWVLSRSPRGKAIGTPAIAHPLNKGFRTAMTIAMFGLIIFIVVVFSIFGTIFNPNGDGEKGGYDLLATSSMPIEDIHNITFAGDPGEAPIVSYETLDGKIANAHGITEHYIYGNYVANGEELVMTSYGPSYKALFGIDGGYASYIDYGFTVRSGDYGSDREVWLAVAGDPDLCIVDKNTAGNWPDIGVGSVLSISDGSGLGGSRNYTVVGVADEFAFTGMFVQKQGLRADFPQLRGDTLFLLTVRDGYDQWEVAKDLESDLSAAGMNVLVFDDLIADYNRAVDQIFSMFTLFMGLGLVVGVASLGVLAVRSVIERRQEIGIMRAIGFRKGMVLGVFSTEMLFVTVVGVLIGLGTGILTGYGIWSTNMTAYAVDFVVPWDNILMVIGITIVAAIVCTFIPAYKASRTNPAEAVRWIE